MEHFVSPFDRPLKHKTIFNIVLRLIFLDGSDFWRGDCLGNVVSITPVSGGNATLNSSNIDSTTSSTTESDESDTTESTDRRRRYLMELHENENNNTTNIVNSSFNFGCGPHRHGPLCRSCDVGYTRQGNDCKFCPTQGLRTLPISLLIIVTTLFIIGYVCTMKKAWKKEYNSIRGIEEEEEEEEDLAAKKGEMEGNIDTAKDLKSAGTDIAKNDTIKKSANSLKNCSGELATKAKRGRKAVTGAAITGSQAIAGTFGANGGNSSSNPFMKIKATTKQLFTFMQLQCSFIITFDQIEWPIGFRKISLSGEI